MHRHGAHQEGRRHGAHQEANSRAAHLEVHHRAAHQENNRAIHRGVRHRAEHQREESNRAAYPQTTLDTVATLLWQDAPYLPPVRRPGRSLLFLCTTIQKAFAATVVSRSHVLNRSKINTNFIKR